MYFLIKIIKYQQTNERADHGRDSDIKYFKNSYLILYTIILKCLSHVVIRNRIIEKTLIITDDELFDYFQLVMTVNLQN